MFSGASLTALEEKGSLLERIIPTTPGCDEAAIRCLNQYRSEIADTLTPIVAQWMGSLSGYALRWCDFLHVPQSNAADNNVQGDHNAHRPTFVGRLPSISMANKYDQLWKWYSGRDSYRLFMMAKTFTWKTHGVILTNEPAMSSHPLGYKVFSLKNAMSLIASKCKATRVQFATSSDADWDDCAEAVSGAIATEDDGGGVNRLYAQLAEDAKDIDSDRIKRALARYLVATYFYEEDVISDASRGFFYYWFEPYLPGVAKMMTGTGVGFHAPTMPVDFMFTSCVTYLNNLWARYIVRAETHHRFMVSAHYSARAAIMSRNLSHNLGSHSLANPDIFNAIGILGEVSEAPDASSGVLLSYKHPVIEIIEPDGELRVRRTAITGPDLIRRFEIETLSSCVTRGEAWRARVRLGEFHSYIQARLDFIARALGETRSSFEPMFFIGDLLKGFLSQTVLLNTLFADNGYTASDMEFCIYMPDGATLKLSGLAEDHELRHVHFRVTEQPKGLNDLLVAIPGGMVGRHAFYAFLENLLRNAVKYGTHSRSRSASGESRLRVHIRLRRQSDVGAYVLECSDNLSEVAVETSGEVKVVDQIRMYLDQGLIEEDSGRARSEGHGIQEMKLCAQFMSGSEVQALHFGPDSQQDAHGFVARCIEAKDYAKRSKHVQATPQSIACYPSTPWGDRRPTLTYAIPLRVPQLLTFVDPSIPAEGKKSTDGAVLAVCVVARMAKTETHIGVICAKGSPAEDSNQQLLNDIVRYQLELPCRLMISIPSSDERHKEAWLSAIAASNLPARRIRVIVGDGAGLHVQSSLDDPTASVLHAYERWLKSFKGNPPGGKWNLAIGFERSPEYVRRRWCDGNEHLGFASNLVRLWVVAGRNGREKWYSSDKLDDVGTNLKDVFADASRTPPESKLVFDNHGKVLKNAEQAHSYHAFSGAEQVDLFQLLDSPPSDSFGRAFLVLSVVEAMLTNVVVIDERVADACLDAAGGVVNPYGETITKKQRAGIFPVYGVTGLDKKRHPLSAKTRAALEGVLEGEEGVVVSKDSPFVRTYRKRFPSGKLSAVEFGTGKDEVDIMVIHEGVTDMMQPEGWAEGDHVHLNRICPIIVRTSGRGALSRHLGKNLPFLEFSELAESVYRQMNKVALVRGLLALRGASS